MIMSNINWREPHIEWREPQVNWRQVGDIIICRGTFVSRIVRYWNSLVCCVVLWRILRLLFSFKQIEHISPSASAPPSLGDRQWPFLEYEGRYAGSPELRVSQETQPATSLQVSGPALP